MQCQIKKVIVLGMPLMEWTYKSCVANIAEGGDWATIYGIESREPGKGHATTLLLEAKDYYKDKRFGGTVSLNPRMASVYKKCGIKEYK